MSMKATNEAAESPRGPRTAAGLGEREERGSNAATPELRRWRSRLHSEQHSSQTVRNHTTLDVNFKFADEAEMKGAHSRKYKVMWREEMETRIVHQCHCK